MGKAIKVTTACSEESNLRGEYYSEPSELMGQRMAGYIDTLCGERVWVKDDENAAKLKDVIAPYCLLTLGPVEKMGGAKVASVRGFVTLQVLDSAGEMACGYWPGNAA